MPEDDITVDEKKDDESVAEQGAETHDTTSTIICWQRVVDARVADCDGLPRQAVTSLITDFSVTNGIRDFLRGHVAVFTSPTSDPTERRKSFETIKLFFARIDDQAKQDATDASDAMGRNHTSAIAQVDIHLDSKGVAEQSAREEQDESKQTANIDGDATAQNVNAVMNDNSNNSRQRSNNDPAYRAQHEGEATGNHAGGASEQATCGQHDVILGPAYANQNTRGKTILDETLKACAAKFLHLHTAEAKMAFCRKVYSKLLAGGIRFLIQESPTSTRLVALDEKKIIALLLKGLSARARDQQNRQPPPTTRALAVTVPQQQTATVRLVSRSEIRPRDVLLGEGLPLLGNKYYNQQYRFYRNQGYDQSSSSAMAIENVRRNGGRFFVAAEASGGFWKEVASDKLHESLQKKRSNPIRLLTGPPKRTEPSQADPQPFRMRPAVAALTRGPEDAVVHQLFRCEKSDVLLGKFEYAPSWPGNKSYTELLNKYARKYPTCRPGQQMERKALIARRAVNDILFNGGRFLKHCQDRTGPETLVEEAWLKVDLKYVEQLTCRMLPDAPEQLIYQGNTDAPRFEPIPTTVRVRPLNQPRLADYAAASLPGGDGDSGSSTSNQQISSPEIVDLTDGCDAEYSSEDAGLVPHEDSLAPEGNMEMQDPIDAEIAELFQETNDSSTADQPASIQEESDAPELTFIYAMSDRKPTHACTQDERPLTKVALPPSPVLPAELTEQVSCRLREWDPFWEIISIVGIGVTCKVQMTSPETQLINTAANFSLSLTERQLETFSLSWGKKRSRSERCDGVVALILRMLPVDKELYEGKRADCHLWPKGTFLQINGEKIWIVQRKQQTHDHSEWKSLCGDLDVTEYIQDPEKVNNFQFFCFDDKPYVFVLSFCRYRSAEQLQLNLTAPSSKVISVLPQESCFGKALNFAAQQVMVTIDDDSGDEAGSNEVGKLIISLLCPISKALMKNPVRGKQCKHFQVWFCFCTTL